MSLKRPPLRADCPRLARAWAPDFSRADRLPPGIDDAHHSLIFMVEYVAVIDGAAGEVLEGDAHLDVAAGGDVDHVLPGGLLELLAVLLDKLHRPDVEVDRVVHRGRVGDDPFLDRP